MLDLTRTTRAAWHAEAWDIDTDRVLQGFAHQIRRNGQIVTKARAESIRRTASGWEVVAGGTTYRAKMLVNAAGAWADAIARLAGITPLGLTPKRRSIACVAAPDGPMAARC